MDNATELMAHIRVLKSRYCRFVDTKDWRAFAGLFSEHARLRFIGESGEIVAGFDQPKEFFDQTKAFLAGARTIHQVHNDELEIVSESEIRAIWSMEDYVIFPDIDDGRPASLHGYGHYHETWRLEPSGWRLARLELRRTILEIKPKEIRS
jgi:3-phenylpropionate/cinnamic acid dioxygenase small subunit